MNTLIEDFRCAKRSVIGVVGLLVIAGSVLLGIYGRFAGNGDWPFSGDEYLIAQSTKHILERGVPSFSCGGIYARGILLQYIMAGASFLPCNSLETVFRSVVAVFAILAVPGVYLLSREIGGKVVAVAAVLFYSLSIWEIELARYARMYVPFQSIFIWYLYFLFRVMTARDEGSEKYLWLLSFVSIFIYAGSIFLCALNFLPWLSKFSKKPRLFSLVFSIPILIAAVSFFIIDWRGIGAETRFPEGFVYSDSGALQQAGSMIPERLGPLLMPVDVIGQFAVDSFWIYPLSLLVLIIGLLTYQLLKAKSLSLVIYGLILALAVLALMNQFFLIAMALLVVWLTGIVRVQDLSARVLYAPILITVLAILFWSFYALFNDQWLSLFPVEVDRPWQKLLVAFFKYPDVYNKILLPWLGGQPITTVIYVLAIGAGFVLALVKRELTINERLAAGILLLLCILVAVLRQPYIETRYTFFVYPLVIVLVLVAIYRASRYLSVRKPEYRLLVFGGLCGVVLVASEDYSVSHLASISSFETNYRIGFERDREHHLWRKFETRTPANYVNSRVTSEDLVISTVRPVHFYLDRLDYFFFDSAVREITVVMSCEGTKEIWTGANLIYRVADLIGEIEKRESPIWLLAFHPSNQRARLADKMIFERYADSSRFSSEDGSVVVYHLAGPHAASALKSQHASPR